MLEENTEELSVGTYIIRWTSVLSNRFDSTAFKKEHSDLYKHFTKQVASRRFTIA
jgi:predicted phage-related endonuclease